ncbi:MAG: glutathione S-transferase [Gammaproteobacteria bacterium]|nr:MAG: glutathione S-transferase [Gammaproteobacteria bacterium]
MKLYDYPQAPNPRRVNIFLAEKGIKVDRVTVDLGKQEQLQPEYIAKNPACDVPMLELDDGTCISQIRGITHYFEAAYPDIPMLGKTPAEKGLVEMWEHLATMNGFLAVAEVFRNTVKGFSNRAMAGPHNYPQSAELAERGALRLPNFFKDFDQQLAKNEYVAGDAFSLADITTLVTCDFAKWIKAEIPEDCSHLRAWYTKVSDRPAVKANP